MPAAMSMFNKKVHSQVINLDRSADRLETIDAYLKAAGVHYERLSAVDGQKLSTCTEPSVVNLFDLELWQRSHHRNPIWAEVGCYLSHIAALRAFLNQNKRWGMILEDDAAIAVNFIEAVLPVVQDDRHWDILKLHARHPGPLIARKHYGGDTRLCSFITKHAGATAYIVTRSAAKKMLDHLIPAIRAYDWVYDEGHRINMRVRTISPMPVAVQHVVSTIECYRNTARKRTWIEKQTDRPLLPRWKLPFYRTIDSFHRVLYNLLIDGGMLALAIRPKKYVE